MNNVPSPSVIEALGADLDRARDTVERLAAEYDTLLADHDAIQEDRDSAAQQVAQATEGLRRAEQALARAESGEYGHCTRCGSEIAPERLEALPDAETCISCR